MGQVMVPERLLEIVQQNNEKAYPQIIMDEASYPYLFHLSDIRQNLIAFLPVTKQMRVLERNAGCGALTCDSSGGEHGGSRNPAGTLQRCR